MSSSEWKRPENVPYPSIWLEFEGKRLINGKKRKYWVQDLTEEYYEECLKYITTIFLDDEPVFSYSKTREDEVSVKECYGYWGKVLKQKMSLLCLTKDENGTTIVAGLNTLGVSKKGDPRPEPTGEKLKLVLQSYAYVYSLQDVYTKFNIDKYLASMGLMVLPDFRGESLGLQILKAREPLCKAVGIEATLTIFTSFISQGLAVKCGFKDIVEVAYKQVDPDETIFPGIQNHTKTMKFMYLRFD